MGNTAIGCELADYCLSGKHTCDANATCYYTGPQEFKCVVSTQARHCNHQWKPLMILALILILFW